MLPALPIYMRTVCGGLCLVRRYRRKVKSYQVKLEEQKSPRSRSLWELRREPPVHPGRAAEKNTRRALRLCHWAVDRVRYCSSAPLQIWRIYRRGLVRLFRSGHLSRLGVYLTSETSGESLPRPCFNMDKLSCRKGSKVRWTFHLQYLWSYL